eukprot:CAMPEP_0204517740 /NCGR_PEP_ID=MMETSP0661-20131031/3832_1 /ASSEMBLY_ACC=CAM_ASM_000606 /TAXON_ID=109239 /ORGANISM="Alexandrium margalefi, Strain AMGDE01CS-322" /LENGTH=95 /DNA_ID=CAMNT_0051523153 /DNA_START=30 /DNA_END=317 /DNA_ORIENTATION=+
MALPTALAATTNPDPAAVRQDETITSPCIMQVFEAPFTDSHNCTVVANTFPYTLYGNTQTGGTCFSAHKTFVCTNTHPHSSVIKTAITWATTLTA